MPRLTSARRLFVRDAQEALATTHAFSLLCGYAMGSFYKDAAVDEICRHHSHVLSEKGEAATIN